MSGRDWMEKTVAKTGETKDLAQREDADGKTGRRARLAEAILKIRKEMMQKEKG